MQAPFFPRYEDDIVAGLKAGDLSESRCQIAKDVGSLVHEGCTTFALQAKCVAGAISKSEGGQIRHLSLDLAPV